MNTSPDASGLGYRYDDIIVVLGVKFSVELEHPLSADIAVAIQKVVLLAVYRGFLVRLVLSILQRQNVNTLQSCALLN